MNDPFKGFSDDNHLKNGQVVASGLPVAVTIEWDAVDAVDGRG